MKLFDERFTVLNKSMDAYSTRAKALSNNIANVNTPNYKRQDVDFENVLSEALNEENNSKIEGRRTNQRHFEINSIPKIETLEAKIIQEKSTIMRNDKNNVDIEKEEAEFAKNNIRYQFAAERLTNNFTILKDVIKSQ